MDAKDKARAIDAMKHLGMLREEGEVPPDSLARATDLVRKVEEALRRTVATSPTYPYCETPSYLWRHQAGFGIHQMLEEAKAWLERHP